MAAVARVAALVAAAATGGVASGASAPPAELHLVPGLVGPDALLSLGLGDGAPEAGPGGNRPPLGQTRSRIRKLEGGPKGARPGLIASGLRNRSRSSFARGTGRLSIAGGGQRRPGAVAY